MAKKEDEGIYLDREIKASKNGWFGVGGDMYKRFPVTDPKLDKGVYYITLDQRDETPIFIKKDIKTDNIISFSNSLYSQIVEEIETFWNSEAKFKKFGFLHKRGYLLYGKQGTGKSCVIQQIIAEIIKRDGLVFICDNPEFLNRGLAFLRSVERDRKIICIFEDIDSIIKTYGDSSLLAVLDGTNMVDNVLNIATTNFPELLSKRITARPRRFDRKIRIDPPDEQTRIEFLKTKLEKKDKIEVWAKKTEGLTFASLTEVIISVKCLDKKLEEAIEIMRNLENEQSSSEEYEERGEFGFSSGSGKVGGPTVSQREKLKRFLEDDD